MTVGWVRARIIDGLTNRERIIYALKNIPQDQRANVAQHALTLYDGVTVGCDRVIYALIKIPQDQRADVAQHALTLCDDVTDGCVRAFIIKAFNTPVTLCLALLKNNFIISLLPQISVSDSTKHNTIKYLLTKRCVQQNL